MRRLKQLRDESSKLSHAAADLSLDKGCCRTSSAETPGLPGSASERTRFVASGACLPAGLPGYHYRSRRPGQAVLEQRIKEICQMRVRYGYRHEHVLLRREGWCINQNKTRHINRELGLQLRNKTPQRRGATPPPIPSARQEGYCPDCHKPRGSTTEKSIHRGRTTPMSIAWKAEARRID
jgi:hypothetical protein